MAEVETQEPIVQIETTEKLVSPTKPDMEVQMQEIEHQLAQIEKDEAKVYLDLFGNYDKEKRGIILVENVYDIAKLVGKDVSSVEKIITKYEKKPGDTITLDEYQKIITELDTLYLDQVTEIEPAQLLSENQRIIISIDGKVVEAIRVLYAHQKVCEGDGRYSEAEMALHKIEQIKAKEIERHQKNIKAFQEQELFQVENAQQLQVVEFDRTWDEYMADFENQAKSSIEKLREKQHMEIIELEEKCRHEYKSNYRASGKLLELRQKEKNLVKLKKYKEAEKVKESADMLEEWERNQKIGELDEIIAKRTDTLIGQHGKTLDAVNKKINKERHQIVKNRIDDTQRLVLKNKNLRNELISKHSQEVKHVTENIKSNLTLLHSGEPAIDIKNLASTTTTRRIPSSHTKGVIRSPLKFSFKDDLFSSIVEKTAEKKNANDEHVMIENQEILNLNPEIAV